MPLMTTDEVADELRVSPDWVYANRHLIGFIQVTPRRISFDRDDVERYISKRRRGPQQEGSKWESQSHTDATERSGSSGKRTTASDISNRLAAIEREKGRHRNTRRSA